MRASRFPAFVLPLIVAVAGLVVPTPGAAINYRDTSAGAACHAANGALANKFTYNLNYLTNISNTDAYVICELVTDDATDTPELLIHLQVDVLVPTPGSNVTCMAQVGSFWDGVNHIRASQAQSYTTVSPDYGFSLDWNEAPLQRLYITETLTINCKLPPGAKLGLIQRWESVPVPG
jgi:hypothetical protein